MGELKDYDIMDIEAMDDERLEKSESGRIQVTRVYIKSEADKLIAKLNMRICEGDEDFEIANNQINRLLKIVRHQKYKRCLAMAKCCDAEIGIADTDCDYEDMQWYQKWYERWLELAKNFNPNNSTAHQCKGKQNG